MGKPGVDSHVTDPSNISITGVEHAYENGFVGKRLLIMQGVKEPDDADIKKMDPNAEICANEKGGMIRKI